MRDCRSIVKDTMNRYNKESSYARILKTGTRGNAIEAFQREPYYLTAARRERAIEGRRLNDYSARGEKAVTDESRESE